MNSIESYNSKINHLDLSLFEKIDTQTSDKERRSLLAIQRCIRKKHPSYIYLEIGSHLGGSIQPYFVDEQCQLIYSIDKRPAAQPDERGGMYEYHDNSTQRMLDLLHQNYPNGNLKKLVTFDSGSDEIDPKVIEPKPQVCFIDGEHTNKAVYQDFQFCYQVAAPDSILVFHDANFIFKGLINIEKYLNDKKVKFNSYALGGSVYVILLGQAIDSYGAELSPFSKDKERFFKRAAKNLSKLRLQRKHPKLYQVYHNTQQNTMYKGLKKNTKKMLIKLGLKKPYKPFMELTEGHLGGYILNKAAPGTWCPEIWDWCIKELGVKSVLDVGCGLGYTLEYFAQANLDVFGVDGSPSAIQKNLMSAAHLHQHDYTKGNWVPEKNYDLIWSSEFLEHVEQKYEANFLATFQSATKYIMVTFAVPGQTGHHHVNLQYGDYWIEKFDKIGFKYEEKLTLKARNMLPKEGLRGMQFRDKGLIFSKK